MIIQIRTYSFLLAQPVFLTRQSKTWRASLRGLTLTQTTALLKGNSILHQTINITQKQYKSLDQAIDSLIDKIQAKVEKGYVPMAQPQACQFSGTYLVRGQQWLKLQVLQERLKISESNEQAYILHFASLAQSQSQALLIKTARQQEGFVQQLHLFHYTFNQETLSLNKNVFKPIKKLLQLPNKTTRHLTDLTDDQMSNRSLSRQRSERSADSGYLTSMGRLGKPHNGPSKVLLAKSWQEQIDPTGLIMSEKLDGVRMFWSGSAMYSRNGNKFNFPQFFTQGWPNSQLDGELWIGRNLFHKTLSAIKKLKPIDEEWQKVTFLVFDAPGLNKIFSQRIEVIQKQLGELESPYIKCHAHRICKGHKDLLEQLENVLQRKGEGLMLRNPESFYQKKRSSNLLKVKQFYDAQAQVIQHIQGQGRLQGMIGSMRVRTQQGVEFDVGSGMTDEERRNPPAVGSWITYKYQEVNEQSGRPRFPIFLRAYQKV